MSQNPYQAILGNFQEPARSLGFMPNPYSNPAQQMIEAQKFMALSKSIMDQMLGGANNSWNRMSPGNPTQAMPFNMQNLFNTFGALANGPGMMLMPAGSQGLLNQGGYQAGSLGTNMSPLLQYYLGQMGKTPEPTPSDIGRAAQGAPNSAAGMTVAGPSPGGQPSMAPGTSQSGLPEGSNRGSTTGGPTSNDVQGPTIPALSGVNDVARQVPLLGGYLSGAENALGDITGRTSPNGAGPSGDIPVLSGLNDIVRGLVPGVGAIGDAARGLMGGGDTNNGQPALPGASATTVNTSGSLAPRTVALLMQRAGINTIPQGVDPNQFVDNLLYKILGGQ